MIDCLCPFLLYPFYIRLNSVCNANLFLSYYRHSMFHCSFRKLFKVCSLLSKNIITARKRSLRRLCFHRCLSVHMGGLCPGGGGSLSRGWGFLYRGVLCPGGPLSRGRSLSRGMSLSRGGVSPCKVIRVSTHTTRYTLARLIINKDRPV